MHNIVQNATKHTKDPLKFAFLNFMLIAFYIEVFDGCKYICREYSCVIVQNQNLDNQTLSNLNML